MRNECEMRERRKKQCRLRWMEMRFDRSGNDLVTFVCSIFVCNSQQPKVVNVSTFSVKWHFAGELSAKCDLLLNMSAQEKIAFCRKTFGEMSFHRKSLDIYHFRLLRECMSVVMLFSMAAWNFLASCDQIKKKYVSIFFCYFCRFYFAIYTKWHYWVRTKMTNKTSKRFKWFYKCPWALAYIYNIPNRKANWKHEDYK